MAEEEGAADEECSVTDSRGALLFPSPPDQDGFVKCLPRPIPCPSIYGFAAVLPGITPPVAIKRPEEEDAAEKEAEEEGAGVLTGCLEFPMLIPMAFLKVNCTPPPLVLVEAAIIDDVIAFGTD